MKTKRITATLIALALVALLCACGVDSRIASSGKLISGYFNVGEQDKADVVVICVESWQDGYLALARYTGSGSHLLLFKIQKSQGGAEKITAVCEGGVAGAPGYSVNIVVDGGKTIVFGDFAGAGSVSPAYKSIEFTFDDGAKAPKNVGGESGYIVVTGGGPKVTDFVLKGSGKTPDGSYKAYVDAGGGVTRSSFSPIKGN